MSTATRTSYVLGFAFTPEHSHVLLVEKNRGPGKMRGKLNGIGGHVDKSESPMQAMRREAIEEVGLVKTEWRQFACMDSGDWTCACFTAVSYETEDASHETDVGEKTLIIQPSDALLRPNLMVNLRWLIPMAMEDGIVGASIAYATGKRGDQ